MISKGRAITQKSKALNNLVDGGRLAIPVKYYSSGCTFAIDFLSENALGRLSLMKENAFSFAVTFLFQQNTPLVSIFNKFFEQLSGSGILLHWQTHYSNHMIGEHYRNNNESINDNEYRYHRVFKKIWSCKTVSHWCFAMETFSQMTKSTT